MLTNILTHQEGTEMNQGEHDVTFISLKTFTPSNPTHPQTRHFLPSPAFVTHAYE